MEPEPIKLEPTAYDTPRTGQGEGQPIQRYRDVYMEREKRNYDACPCSSCPRRAGCDSECVDFRMYVGTPGNPDWYKKHTSKLKDG